MSAPKNSAYSWLAFRMHFILFAVGLPMAGITFAANALDPASDRSKAVVLEVIEGIINGRNLELADEFIHPDLVQHTDPGIAPGLDGFKAHYKKTFERFATYQFELRRIAGEEGMVAIQGRLHGVTKGNNKINFRVSDFYRLEDGKVIEIWRVQQLLN